MKKRTYEEILKKHDGVGRAIRELIEALETDKYPMNQEIEAAKRLARQWSENQKALASYTGRRSEDSE